MKKIHTTKILAGLSLTASLAIINGPAFAMDAESEKITNATEIKFESSGGVPGRGILCPKSPYDVIVPLESLNPPAKEGTPEMTVDGMWEFIQKNKIKNITDLVNTLPNHYRTTFSLVEVTRAAGQSTLEYPRIVLFGPDGRFLANVGTLTSDPAYDLLDIAQLYDDTGIWEFSQFDFSGPEPKLHRNMKSCQECHGAIEPRPTWGTNLDWPGVMGDNIAKGRQGEALDGPHAVRMNEIREGKGNNPRFDFLIWKDKRLKRGGKRLLAHHALGADLFISNIAMGSATAAGVFKRMQLNYPIRYKELKEIVLLLGYDQFNEGVLSASERDIIFKKMAKYGAKEATLDEALMLLGVNTREAFSLHTMAETETPDTNWKMGGGTLYEAVLLQLMDDLAKNDEEFNETLMKAGPGDGVFKCPDLAKNMKDIVDFKMMHLFHLKGDARYQVHWVFYPADLEHINKTVLRPTLDSVPSVLKRKIIQGS